MIPINELRFDNWVLDGFGNHIQIKDIISEGNTSGYKLATLSPIPLSPEILHAAKFSSAFSTDPQERPASKIYELNGLKIHQYDEEENKFEFYNDSTHEIIEITGVHHLQNLYYYSFNTGQELTINLK